VAAARAIVENGVDLDEASADARWGRAFYSSTVPAPQYGEAEVTVAIRLLNPLEVAPTEIGDVIRQDVLEATGLDDIRAAVLAMGHDGVVIHYPYQETWVIAFRAEQVKVVVEDGRDG
jgi:hypothetical protein